ncbi:glycosyl hydrolase [Polychaeton citri CBS 116435]|uniref:Vacuolar protein sorting/targeting protein 10 n=1 Tax=Polychaeton citri CBS 116435 TaxID=1314669 RepID=A0A9P4UTP4_9PEZI|nr:glycosyl hydrolase [Polychaeton citri CBS 116435]
MLRRLALSFCLLLCLLWPAAAKDAKTPKVESTKFDHIPSNIFYFDESETVLFNDRGTGYISFDGGFEWQSFKDVDKGGVAAIFKHPYHDKTAVAVGNETKHWITKDQGRSWDSFETEMPVALTPSSIAFHGSDPNHIIFMGAFCKWGRMACTFSAYYTRDGFETKPKLLREDAYTCLWAKATDILSERNKDLSNDRALCIVPGDDLLTSNFRLSASDDFFKTEHEPVVNNGRAASGYVNLASEKSYIVAAATSIGSKELAMFVTVDTHTWHLAEFGDHQLREDAYTLLESTNYSMQVDVMTGIAENPIGAMFTSNSNGTFFTKNIDHTNRNAMGFVDFEKVQNIQGIVLVNTVDNWKDVQNNEGTGKVLKTSISFDDGRTFHGLETGDGDELHLHSFTENHNVGRIFTSPAPGILMGIGNTGKHLKQFDKGDTYVSDDAGLTWRSAIKGPHLYEFGDQGAILVAVHLGSTDKISWSLDHGKVWESMELDSKFTPSALTTVADSTALKFLLTATSDTGSKSQPIVYALDFAGLHERDCKDGDFEDWHARVDKDGKASCIMGHKQTFRRRKADSKCFVNQEFKDPQPKLENCKCTKEDYECDYNFVRNDDRECVAAGLPKAPEGSCREGDETYKGPSGYRLIPGNTCIQEGGEVLDEPVERPCEKTQKKPQSGKIGVELTPFDGDKFVEYYYLEKARNNRKDDGTDETVVMLTEKGEAYVTKDHGKIWKRIIEDDNVVAIYPHQYLNDHVYFITSSKTVYYSADSGNHIHSFDAPELPNKAKQAVLQFHPNNDDWLIWTGSKCSNGDDCQTISHVSTKGGRKWDPLLPSVRKCLFVYQESRANSSSLVYCEQQEDENPENDMILYSSTDWFEHKQELKRDVVNFAIMSEYIVVAVRNITQDSLSIDSSIDGITFADAKWPTNFQVKSSQAYTVLDSSTHSVFLHVTVNSNDNQWSGSILKSNSNGTNYVLSLNNVNRNKAGYVDFEKMQGLEGVAVANVVANSGEVDKGKPKKIKTKITHNDGAEWGLVPPPEEDADGKKFSCSGKSLEKCSLHLHGYTERRDPRDTFSSASAVGLMVGLGNVGEYLDRREDSRTFITRDGGISWKQVSKKPMMWEFGDQGSIIVLVDEGSATNEVIYSLDEGKNWQNFQFLEDDKMDVTDITTVPSDSSRNFLLWGSIKGKLATLNLDFSGLEERSRHCTLVEANPEADDYYLWKPKHPLSDSDCLFGHVAQYHRKRPESKCYNGKEPLDLHNIESNCTCTRQDFECDYNFELNKDGTCSLVPGEIPLNPTEFCQKNPDAIEYPDITGYRKIPLSTCQEGKQYDRSNGVHSCAGHESEFAKKHGISGIGLFFAIILPVMAAAGVGYWVWQSWEGKFGTIRLGEGGTPGFSIGSGAGSVFDRDAPWIKYPVMALSGIVAVLAALPMVGGSLWKTAMARFGRSSGSHSGWASRPYTSRSSFARGRGDYAVVDPDEGELLGEESDDDV